MLEDAVLGLGQAIVVGVQNFVRAPDVQPVCCGGAPWQIQQHINVVADDANLGRHGLHLRHAFQLFERALLHLFRHAGSRNARAQLALLLQPRVALAKLAMNGLELLAQIHLALPAVHGVLHL